MEGTYRVAGQDLGAYSLSLSADGLATVSDPQQQNGSASSSFTLTVDGVEYQITPESATLASLAAAVNASGAPVEATIVNVGSSSSPDYQLSLRSTALGAVPMQLNDGEADLLDSMSAGRKASYTLNGKTVETDSRTVTVGPGLELLLKAEGSTEITVSTSTSAISSALSSLATAYNAALSELDSHRGEDAGALKGSSLVYSLAAALRELAGYAAGSGDIDSLNGVGLTFQSDGKLSFDASTFEAAAANRSALAEFLGSASSGGFLKYATDLLDGLENDSSGLITENLSSLSRRSRNKTPASTPSRNASTPWRSSSSPGWPPPTRPSPKWNRRSTTSTACSNRCGSPRRVTRHEPPGRIERRTGARDGGGRLSDIAGLVDAFQSEFERLAAQRRPPSPEEAEAAQAALALLTRAVRAQRALRAHDTAALARLRAARPYRAGSLPRVPAVELAG
jgi:hypothetical protein